MVSSDAERFRLTGRISAGGTHVKLITIDSNGPYEREKRSDLKNLYIWAKP